MKTRLLVICTLIAAALPAALVSSVSSNDLESHECHSAAHDATFGPTWGPKCPGVDKIGRDCIGTGVRQNAGGGGNVFKCLKCGMVWREK